MKKRWADMPKSERHQRASLAAASYDLEELWSLVEAHKKLAVTSRRSYKQQIQRFLEHAKRVGLNLLLPAPGDGERYFAELEDTLQTATRRQARAAINNLYSALRWCGHNVDLLKKVKLPKVDDVALESYSQEEIEALLRVSDSEERVLILLAAHAGLTTSEVLALRWKDVGEVLSIHRPSRAKERVRISRRLRLALGVHRSERQPEPDDLVLTKKTVLPRLETISRRAGVGYRHYLALRYAAGLRLYQETRDLILLADHLRIKNMDQVRRYADQFDERDLVLQQTLDKWTGGDLESIVDNLKRVLGPAFSPDMLLYDSEYETYLLATGDLSETEKARIETLIESAKKKGIKMKLVQRPPIN